MCWWKQTYTNCHYTIGTHVRTQTQTHIAREFSIRPLILQHFLLADRSTDRLNQFFCSIKSIGISLRSCKSIHIVSSNDRGIFKYRIWHNFRNSEQKIEWINFRTDSLYLIHVSFIFIYKQTNKKYFLFRALKKTKRKKNLIISRANNLRWKWEWNVVAVFIDRYLSEWWFWCGIWGAFLS